MQIPCCKCYLSCQSFHFCQPCCHSSLPCCGTACVPLSSVTLKHWQHVMQEITMRDSYWPSTPNVCKELLDRSQVRIERREMSILQFVSLEKDMLPTWHNLVNPYLPFLLKRTIENNRNRQWRRHYSGQM